LAADQGDLSERTGDLHGDVEKHAAEQRAAAGDNAESGGPKPGDAPPQGQQGDAGKPNGESGQPSGQPGQPGDAAPMNSEPAMGEGDNEDSLAKRLEAAQRAMEEARKKLEEANRKEAAAEQRKALEQLKAAQAEIERILRQMREEQVSRTLVALEQRFRAMLDAEIAVYDETKRLDKTPVEQRSAEDDIKAARIGRKQQEIVLMCDRALALLHEDGSAAALSEAVEQIGGDMRTVAELLGQSRVDAYTQQIEQDVIAALDEILAAVKQAQIDAKKPRPPGDSGEFGPPGEPPLVDMLAELKMLRTMQVRVNRRLKQFGELVQIDETSDPQLRKGLDELAGRQERLVEITRDIVTGKTQ
jgi:DNA repair exonuclease SbcCD ATPase subunit